MFKKKSLGQHFLHTKQYVRRVVDAGEVHPGDTILEIGPGEGVLTRELLLRGANVIAIEKDRRLLPILHETFKEEIAKKQLRLIEGDALEMPLSQARLPHSYKVIANVPYYISGALLKKILTAALQPSLLVFLLQKELVERIAREKKESILSLSVKAYGTPVFVIKVPRGAFTPPPNVDSAILCVKNISRKQFKNKKQEEQFFILLHAGFGKKRKLLKRNLEGILKQKSDALFTKAGITEKARAEDVTLPQWLVLATY